MSETKPPPIKDPLDSDADAYRGAILLSDRIHYYMDNLDPRLLHNPDEKPISPGELEDCLDAASYKLRLGDEAHVGGEWVPISDGHPLVLPAHQVAIVKTHEVVNIPRFLIARWNLRVKWVYEGLLWTGGPQVDPGWQGHLYCPIYNLAERQIVIPHKERVFTMDFARTTPLPEHTTTEGYTKDGFTKDGYKVSLHKPRRGKSIQDHDVNRLRSAPFEQLRQLSNIDTRMNSFSTLTFLVLAVVIAALGVVAAVASTGSGDSESVAKVDSGNLVLATVALVFGFSGLLVGSASMAIRFGPIPQGRIRLMLLSIIGAFSLSLGSGFVGRWVALGLPNLPPPFDVIYAVGTVSAVIVGLVILYFVWHRAAAAAPRKWF